MSLFVRRIVLAGLGMVAGALAWPISELLLAAQGGFPSLLLFTMASGGGIGLVFGAVFGSAPGIFLGRVRRTFVGIGWGSLIGLAGGALGFLAGQGLLLAVGETLAAPARGGYGTALPVARSVGWALLGGFVGAADGIRARSGLRVRVGVLGGLLGGILGGLAVEYGRVFLPAEPYGRLGAFVLLGLAISAFFVMIERRLSLGKLRLLNGRFKGKEFILNQRRLSIGSTDACDITVAGYARVYPRHFSLFEKEGEVYILVEGGTVRLNDEPITASSRPEAREASEAEDRGNKGGGAAGGAGSSAETGGRGPSSTKEEIGAVGGPLKFEDVISAGSAKFLYMAE